MYDSNIVYEARLHPVIFVLPVLLTLLPLMVAIQWPFVWFASLLMAGIGGLWIAMTWVTFQFSRLYIKKNQVTLVMGLLVRETVDMPYAKIERVDVRQNILGGLLGYGLLMITGTGGSQNTINYIAHPLTCRRFIEQYMHDL